MPKPYYMDSEKDRDRVIDIINGLLIEKKWTVEIKRHVKRRTTSQNSLMWKWINEVVEHVKQHTGYDADDIHEFFKRKFLMPAIVVIGGEEIKKWSTKKLTTTEMSKYMTDIDRWCISELGLSLPIPEQMQFRG